MPKRKRANKSPASSSSKADNTSTSSDASAPDPSSSSSSSSEKIRFEVELEFVQCLANVEYIHHLAVNGTLEEPKFIHYLKYLQDTWTKIEYARFLTFPHCLAYLALLQEPTFRQSAINVQFIQSAKNQQDLHFFHHKTAEVVDLKNQTR